jgi:phage shock protein PspC (stress-responsive transcriptional regulator)
MPGTDIQIMQVDWIMIIIFAIAAITAIILYFISWLKP